jgi:hypothetical protein
MEQNQKNKQEGSKTEIKKEVSNLKREPEFLPMESLCHSLEQVLAILRSLHFLVLLCS